MCGSAVVAVVVVGIAIHLLDHSHGLGAMARRGDYYRTSGVEHFQSAIAVVSGSERYDMIQEKNLYLPIYVVWNPFFKDGEDIDSRTE